MHRDLEARIVAMERAQPVLAHLGITVGRVASGKVDLHLRPDERVVQQNGFVHAGVVATMADTAGGFAAYSPFAPGEDILTIEFKLNLLRPAAGEWLVARGRVLKPGRTITVAESEVWARQHADDGPPDVLVAKGPSRNNLARWPRRRRAGDAPRAPAYSLYSKLARASPARMDPPARWAGYLWTGPKATVTLIRVPPAGGGRLPPGGGRGSPRTLPGERTATGRGRRSGARRSERPSPRCSPKGS